MTLVEVLVSMVIIFIFFLGINAGGLIVLDENIKNDQRDEAVSIAEEAMLRMRNNPYDNMVNFNTLPNINISRKVRGTNKNYIVQRRAMVRGDGSLTELHVVVNWTRNDGKTGPRLRQYNHTLNTIVRR